MTVKPELEFQLCLVIATIEQNYITENSSSKRWVFLEAVAFQTPWKKLMKLIVMSFIINQYQFVIK